MKTGQDNQGSRCSTCCWYASAGLHLLCCQSDLVADRTQSTSPVMDDQRSRLRFEATIVMGDIIGTHVQNMLFSPFLKNAMAAGLCKRYCSCCACCESLRKQMRYVTSLVALSPNFEETMLHSAQVDTEYVEAHIHDRYIAAPNPCNFPALNFSDISAADRWIIDWF